jgi:hypothetical protein
MATVKNLNSGYTITTPKTANVTVNTDWVIINGNLEVLGNTVSITTTDTNILDNIIVLNYGETGPGITKGNAGIAVDRGTLANVEIRYNEGVDAWQATNDGINYQFLLQGGSPTGLTAVVEDIAPVLGGNLNTNGFTFYANANSIFGANVQFNNVLAAPAEVTNATVMSAQAVGAGQAGLYVINQASTNEELVTKRRAFGFSLFL